MGNKIGKTQNSLENNHTFNLNKNLILFGKISKYFQPPEDVENPFKHKRDFSHRIKKSELNRHLTYEKIINITQNTLDTIPFTLGQLNNIEIISTGFFLNSFDDDMVFKNKLLTMASNLSSTFEIKKVEGNQHKTNLMNNLRLTENTENKFVNFTKNENYNLNTNNFKSSTKENSSSSFNFEKVEFLLDSKTEPIHEKECNSNSQIENYSKQTSSKNIQNYFILDNYNNSNSYSNLKKNSTTISLNKNNNQIKNQSNNKNLYFNKRSISPNGGYYNIPAYPNYKNLNSQSRSPNKTNYETGSKIKKIQIYKTEIPQNLPKQKSLSPSPIRINENSDTNSKNFINKTRINSKLNYSKSPDKDRNNIYISDNKKTPKIEMIKNKSRNNLIYNNFQFESKEIKPNQDYTKISTIACEDSNYYKSLNNSIESLSLNTYNTNHNNPRENKISYSDFILKKKENISPSKSPKGDTKYFVSSNKKNNLNYSPSYHSKNKEETGKKMKILKINLKNLLNTNSNDHHESNSGISFIQSNENKEQNSSKNFNKNNFNRQTNAHTYEPIQSKDYSMRNLELLEIFRNNTKEDKRIDLVEDPNIEIRRDINKQKTYYNGINQIIK